MKVTVCFGSVRILVPCGSGEISVQSLTEQAVTRYKKATNKHPDDWVSVHVLETGDDHAILDPDDQVIDVLDDKEKLIALFEEKLTRRQSHNGGDGTSASSVGTASPDIFQGEINGNTPKDLSKTEGNVAGLRDRVGSDTSSHSELSDINNDFKHRTKTQHSQIEIMGSSKNIGPPDSKKSRTPSPDIILDNSGFESGHSSDNEEGFIMGRNVARKSLFIDHPLLDRWSDLQEQRMEMANGRQEPAGASVSPSEEKPSFNIYNEYEDDSFSNQSMDSDLITVELKLSQPGDLGISVTGYRTADGRELGLIVGAIDSNGCAGKDGRLQVADRIIEVNGKHLSNHSNQRAEELYHQAINRSSLVTLGVSRTHSFMFPEKQRRKEAHVQNKSSKPPLPPPRSGASLAMYEHHQQRLRTFPSPDQTKTGIQTDENITPPPPPEFSDTPTSTSEHKISPRSISSTSFVPVPYSKHSEVSEGRHYGRVSPTLTLSSVKQAITATVQESSQIDVHAPVVDSKESSVDIISRNKDVASDDSKSSTPALSRNSSSSFGSGSQSSDGTTSNIKRKRSRKVTIELQKGKDGLGFSITTRDNQTGKSPIFVKTIHAQGSAIEDGRLRSGDQILEVNGMEMTGKSQQEAVDILRSARGYVKLIIVRQETVQEHLKAPDEEAMITNGDFKRMTCNIPLNIAGAAGLGISVKGKTTGDTDPFPKDLGIFVKAIISGGAADQDGRLKPDDQLLSINHISLEGLSNADAMNMLRQAMMSIKQDSVEVIAVRKDMAKQSEMPLKPTKSEEELDKVGQDRAIDVAIPEDEKNNEIEEQAQVENGDDKDDSAPTSDEDGEDDIYDNVLTLNLSANKSSHPVKRNRSYYAAMGEVNSPSNVYSPLRNVPRVPAHRHQHKTPLRAGANPDSIIRARLSEVEEKESDNKPAMTSTPLRSPRSVYSILADGAKTNKQPMNILPNRPISTVAVPTPSSSTTETWSSFAIVKTPRPASNQLKGIIEPPVVAQKKPNLNLVQEELFSKLDQIPPPPPPPPPSTLTQPPSFNSKLYQNSAPNLNQPAPSYSTLPRKRRTPHNQQPDNRQGVQTLPRKPQNKNAHLHTVLTKKVDNRFSALNNTNALDTNGNTLPDPPNWMLSEEEVQEPDSPSSPPPADDAFKRDGFARQSISEKRKGMLKDLPAHVEEFRQKARNAREKKSTQAVNRPPAKEQKPEQVTNRQAVPRFRDTPGNTASLPRKLSQDVERPTTNLRRIGSGSAEDVSTTSREIRTFSQLKRNSLQLLDTRTGNGNDSFKMAMEQPFQTPKKDEKLNGHAVQPSDEVQPNVPITMTSNADFSQVQKVAKKKQFHVGLPSMFSPPCLTTPPCLSGFGSGKRGDYSVAKAETSIKSSPPTKRVSPDLSRETPVDSVEEQRYRQLVQYQVTSDELPVKLRTERPVPNNYRHSTSTFQIKPDLHHPPASRERSLDSLPAYMGGRERSVDPLPVSRTNRERNVDLKGGRERSVDPSTTPRGFDPSRANVSRASYERSVQALSSVQRDKNTLSRPQHGENRVPENRVGNTVTRPQYGKEFVLPRGNQERSLDAAMTPRAAGTSATRRVESRLEMHGAFNERSVDEPRTITSADTQYSFTAPTRV